MFKKAHAIPIELTPFSKKYFQNVKLQSAGMLVFSICPKTHNIFFLLGKDNPHGLHLGNWCDLGGRYEEGETDAMTASREFMEESLACVRFNALKPNYKLYHAQILHMLETEDYYMKIAIILGNGNHRRKQTYFLKQIPWNPEICHTFNMLRNQISKLQDTKLSSCPYTLKDHPALVKNYEKETLSVNPCFLEKQSINWWSLDRLKEVIKHRGKFKNQRFRKSFMPVLRVVVQHFEKFYLE